MTYPDDDGPIAELPALDAHAGPARRIASARAHDLVQAALAAASAADQVPSLAAPSVRPPSARRSRAARLIAIALAATLVAALAMAGAALVARLRAPEVSPAAPPAEPSADVSAAATSAEDPAAVAPSPEPLPDPTAAPEEIASAAPSASIARPPAPEARPRDLLEIANQLRSQKRWREAEAVYARVAREFPGTSEAYTATVAAAELRLDHLKDAKGAEALYKSAQSSRPDGALSEEADFGVAESHRAAGNAAAEARALRAFLARHPNSPNRPKVEARLAELAAANKP